LCSVVVATGRSHIDGASHDRHSNVNEIRIRRSRSFLMDYILRELTENDLDSVFQLYSLSYKNVAYGFLAQRSYEDFRKILVVGDAPIRLGAFRDGRLLSYLLTGWKTGNPYPDCRFLRDRIHDTTRILEGKGMSIAPEAQGKKLGEDMIRAREQRMRAIGADFLAGLVHIHNQRSLRVQCMAEGETERTD
jgi:GNAT superfamily N-acetyltransferase